MDQNGNYALNKLVGVRLTSSPALNMHYYNRGHTYRDALIPYYLSFLLAELLLRLLDSCWFIKIPKGASFQINQIYQIILVPSLLWNLICSNFL